MKIINVMMNKGGSGKTFLSTNLAYGLAQKGYRVLFVDGDPQHNATSRLLPDKVLEKQESANLLDIQYLEDKLQNTDLGNDLNSSMNILRHFANGGRRSNELPTLGQLLVGEVQMDEVIVKSKYDNIDLISAGQTMFAQEKQLLSEFDGKERLLDYLKPVEDKYDVCICDNSPYTSVYTFNALNACRNETDLNLLPLRIDFEGFEGLNQTFELLRQAGKNPNFKSKFCIVSTQTNSRVTIGKTGYSVLKKLFGNKVSDVQIRYQLAPNQKTSFDKACLLADERKDVRTSGLYQDMQALVDDIDARLRSE